MRKEKLLKVIVLAAVTLFLTACNKGDDTVTQTDVISQTDSTVQVPEETDKTETKQIVDEATGTEQSANDEVETEQTVDDEVETKQTVDEITETGRPVDEPEKTEAEQTAGETENAEPNQAAEKVFTHKDEYMMDILETILSLLEEKPESSLKQKDVDCDTLQWFNATYAMFVHASGDDYHLIAGFNDESNSCKDYVRDQLDKSWGITDRETMVDTLCWLAYEGHATEFAELMQMMDQGMLLDCSELILKSYFELLGEEAEWSEEDTLFAIKYYADMRKIYDICLDNGIDAWDYCRIMQLCGDCYFVGYITLEENLTIQLAVAKAMQEQFDSWQELNDSYFYGYSYWAYGSYMVDFRKKSYDELMEMEDSPYKTLDFNMELVKFW